MSPTRRTFLARCAAALATVGLCRFPAPAPAAESPRIPQPGDPYPGPAKLKLKGVTCDGRTVVGTYTLSWDCDEQAWTATVPTVTCT